MTLLRKKRLVIVLCIAAVSAAGIGGGVAYRLRKIRHNFLVARDAGYGEYQNGDNAGAIRDLGHYLTRFPQDTTALGAFARARLKVEEPDGSHLIQAINAYRRLADLQGETPELRHKLADLYLQANLNTECIAITDRLLTPERTDAEALHNRAIALYRLRKYKDASDTMQEYLALRPEELESQILQLELLSHVGPPVPDLVKHAEAIRSADPDELKWKVLESIACAMSGDQAGSKKWAKETTEGTAAEPFVAGLQVQQLWRVGEVQAGDRVLEKAAAAFPDPAIRALWARRLYQLRRYGDVVMLAPIAADSVTLRANLAGYQALAWIALKDVPKAESIQKELAADPRSANAHDWATMLGMTINPDALVATARGRVIREIAERRPDNAYFQMMLAGVSQTAGDMRETMRTWDAVAVREPAWAEPVTRMAEALQAAGRYAEAAKAAQVAVARAPQDQSSLVLLALSMAAAGGTPEDGNNVLALVNKIHQQFPSEQRTMALRVSITAQMKDKDAAIEALKEALALQPTPSLVTILQLATVSRSLKLGQEEACFAAAEKAYGMPADLAYAKAIAMLNEGRTAEGAALLKEKRDKATTDVQGWDSAYARYLEVAHDRGAHDQWLALGDKYPADQRMQWLILSAPSIQNDHEAAGKAIERLRALMGESDFGFKLARARWLLQGAPAEAAVSEAATMLGEMTKGQPDVLTPHLLLAECLEHNQNFSGAIEQLEMATALAPDSAPISVELIRLLQNQGNLDRASVHLLKLSQRKDLTEAETRQCAGLLARQGLSKQAIAMLEAGMAKSDGSETDRLMLAALEAQTGNAEKAGPLFDSLMMHPTPPVIRLAAQFYATHGRLADAQRAIAQLRKLELDPAVLAAEEGDFAARFGRPEEVVAAYSAGLKAAPTNAMVWYRLIGFHLQSGAVKEAEAAIDQAVKAIPTDKVLSGLQGKKRYIESLSGDARCRPILLSLLNAPQHTDAAEAVLARLDQAKGTMSPDPQLATDLGRLADRYPQYAALQTLAVEVDVVMGRLDEAVEISMRAMQTFPTSPEPARLATAAFAAGSRWSETLGMSNQWRTRSADQTLAPDVMIGLSYLGMNKPEATIEQIKPYMEQAEADPEAYSAVIVLYGRSELAQNHIAKAEAKLWPLAKTSKRGMVSFLQVAGHDAPPEVGKKWLTMAHAELRGDIELEYVFATAASELAIRANDPSVIAMALEGLQKATSNEKAEPAQRGLGYLALGMLQEGQHAIDAAEASYRKAVALNPTSDAACNNLAMLLARKGAVPEALTFANRAVSLSPKVAAFQDTLAFVQDKAGDHDAAIEHLQLALQLQPTNFEWRINLAQTYINAGQPEKARSTLANADGTPIQPAAISANLKDRLSTLRERLGMKF